MKMGEFMNEIRELERIEAGSKLEGNEKEGLKRELTKLALA